MRYTTWTGILLLTVLACAAPAGAAGKPAGTAADAAVLNGTALNGTFLQLSERYRDWKAEDWRRLFGDFSRLGIERLVVQWSVADEVAFYPSERFETVADPPLEILLALADTASMEVLVGLVHDSAFWQRIARDEALVEVYLKRLRGASIAAARELEPLVERHASFRGWYLPEEIDDVHWLEDASREILVHHLRETSQTLRELTPRSGVAISGFTNAHADPVTLGEFWHELLARTSIDRVLFQDGVGAGKLETEELPLYLGALRPAVEDAGRRLEVIVEVFEQVAGEPIDTEAFRAVPAPAERVRRQIEIAAAYSTGGPVAFSVPEYMTWVGGKEAEALGRALVADP